MALLTFVGIGAIGCGTEPDDGATREPTVEPDLGPSAEPLPIDDAGTNGPLDSGVTSPAEPGDEDAGNPQTDDAGDPSSPEPSPTIDAGAGATLDAGASAGVATAVDAGTAPAPIMGVELIADRHFSRGFIGLDPVTGNPTNNMSPGFGTGSPLWQLGQWGSDSDISAVSPTTLASGAKRWADALGAVTVGSPGTPDADLTFHLNANAEYGGVYRTPTDPVTWPHLLVQQRLSPPGNAGPGCPPLSSLSSLTFSAEAKLLFDNRNLGTGYNAGRHAGSYYLYFTVQNLRTPNTPGYGDYLWFGLTLYDDREAVPALNVAGDDATGKLIYNIGLAPLTDDASLNSASLNDNAWHPLEEDLLPHILLALNEAWTRGYLSNSQNLADYRIGGMNVGWEIPGLNDAALQIRDLSLTYTTQDSTPNPPNPPSSGTVQYDFNVDGDGEGWTASNMTALNSGPLNGLWLFNVPGSDPALLSPALRLDTTLYSTLQVTLANDGNPAAGSRMQVFWSLETSPGFSEAQSMILDVSNGGGWSTYTFDLANAPAWTGVVDRIRIDPIQYGDGSVVGFDEILISP